jgi:hypothetical protein
MRIRRLTLPTAWESGFLPARLPERQGGAMSVTCFKDKPGFKSKT